MNRKGFTLIELLAVIVILGIITLIAIPSVSNIIKNSREKVAKVNAQTYLSELEKYVTMHDLDQTTYPYDLKGKENLNVNDSTKVGDDTIPSLNSVIHMENKGPKSGTVSFDGKGKVSEANLVYDNNKVDYNNGSYTVSDKTNEETVACNFETQTFDYDTTNGGKEEVFTVPCDGTYKLEVWGAQGGSCSNSLIGGYGGYSVGKKNLNNKDLLYINVGGAGKSTGAHALQLGGYNGGGTATPDWDSNTIQASGGGATHIALVSGLLSTLESQTGKILIVAGGGGGGATHVSNGGCTGGSGGGSVGGKDSGNNVTGGSQTEGGKSTSAATDYIGVGMFGAGFSGIYSGGGGGYYGGGAFFSAASGGSGYIEGLTEAEMDCYGCDKSDDTSTKTNPVNDHNITPTPGIPKEGNGYAKITYVE